MLLALPADLKVLESSAGDLEGGTKPIGRDSNLVVAGEQLATAFLAGLCGSIEFCAATERFPRIGLPS